jgi:hypothetical protein
VKILSLSFIGILLVATAATDSASVNSITNRLLSQIAEATTTTTDMSFGAKALEFLTYCNNQFSQTPISSMTTDILVFCTMVYDWYLMGCNNNNAIVAPIIAAQCNDPVIIQQVINYKTEIDIRIKQIVNIEVSPPGDGGGGNGNLHDLTISITIAKNPITRGNVQTITVTVSDAESNEKIQGAKVNGKVQYVTAHTETLSCITDSSGKCSHSWQISGNTKPGTFTISVQASESGYKPASKTTTFGVVAKNDNATLPITNNTIVNDTSRLIVNDTDINGNETGLSDGEQGDTGSDNGNITLLPPPDPCIENPSLTECISATVLPSNPIADPCIENPSLPECTLPEPPPLCEEDPTAEGCETLSSPQVEPQVEEEETTDEEEVEGTIELTEDEEEEESEDVDEEEGETESEESSSDEEE